MYKQNSKLKHSDINVYGAFFISITQQIYLLQVVLLAVYIINPGIICVSQPTLVTNSSLIIITVIVYKNLSADITIREINVFVYIQPHGNQFSLQNCVLFIWVIGVNQIQSFIQIEIKGSFQKRSVLNKVKFMHQY